MRVTLVISSLSSGGAERVMSIMANYWAEKDWPVSLLTFDDGRESPFYKLDPRISHIPIGVARPAANRFQGITNNVWRIKMLRRAIRHREPDAVIAFLDKVNVLTLLATVGTKLPIVVSERVDPRLYSIGRLWNHLRNWAFRCADRVVVQTESAKGFLSASVQRRARVIPNPVIPPVHYPPGPRRKNGKQIVGMGRLTRQKGFDLFLEAFARVAPRHPDWSVVIWGEGEERQALERQRDQLGLHDLIRFPGRTKRPYAEMTQADLFVLSSRFEGFPNVLCEAMACGLPVISFACPSGPGDIIRHGTDGLLVAPENIGHLAAAMEHLMADEQERERLSHHTIEISARFNLEKIMNMWETLLDEVREKRNR